MKKDVRQKILGVIKMTDFFFSVVCKTSIFSTYLGLP